MLNNKVTAEGGLLLGVDNDDANTVSLRITTADPRVVGSQSEDTVGSLVMYVNGADSALLQKKGTGNLDWVRADVVTGTPEVVTSGALSVTRQKTNLSVTGTQAYTLAVGTVLGQRKEIECTVAASTPLGTLTLADAFGSEPLTHVFTAVGQKLVLEWTATGWKMIEKVRAGVEIFVIGTTVTTGFDMGAVFSCSVTGTVSSTVAANRGVPNGTIPGEILIVACSTAASTPIGNVEGLYLTLANTNATDLQAIGATTDTVTLQWTGARWLVIANSGITVA